MKNNRHSDPSLSAKGSKVASASHVKGITMKLMKSDPVSGGDGEGVEGAIHGSPEEGSWKRIFPTYLGNRLQVKRSSQHESPSSSEASSPLSRKKKRSKRIHLASVVKHLSRTLSPLRSSQHESSSSSEASSPLSRKKKRSKRIHVAPVVKHLSRTLSPPSNADALSRKKNAIKSIAIARVLPKRSRRPEPSNTDGEAQSTNEASASLSRKKKFSKRVLDIASNSSSGLPPRTEALSAEEIAMPKQKKSDHSPASQRGSNAHRAGDVSINKADGVEPAHKIDPPIRHSHALVVDNCLDANPRMDKLIPPASRGSSSRIESTWTQEKKVNTPTSSTKEKPPLLRVPKESFQLPTSEKQGPDAEAIENLSVQISSLKCKLNKVPYFRSICDERQQVEVYQRLSRYYIQAHELPSPGEEPDNAQLSKELESSLDAYEIFFHQRFKYNPEWYFHPEQCKLAGLEDYQRLVLRDDPMYGELKQYRLYYHTYQGDVEYVQFREQMAEQIKWIDDETALFGDQRLRNELEAFIQTLRVAIQFPNISGRSVVSALREHLCSLRFDFDHRKDLDGVYLEIWKSVAKNKVNFRDALSTLYEEDIFPFRRPDIKLALDRYPGPSWIKYSYDTYVAGIDERFSEEEAHPLIIEAVERMAEKRKNYLDYAKKKLEIAARIGLKKSNLEVTAQGGDNHGERKGAIVS